VHKAKQYMRGCSQAFKPDTVSLIVLMCSGGCPKNYLFFDTLSIQFGPELMEIEPKYMWNWLSHRFPFGVLGCFRCRVCRLVGAGVTFSHSVLNPNPKSFIGDGQSPPSNRCLFMLWSSAKAVTQNLRVLCSSQCRL
jgi:hypothetical protein